MESLRRAYCCSKVQTLSRMVISDIRVLRRTMGLVISEVCVEIEMKVRIMRMEALRRRGLKAKIGGCMQLYRSVGMAVLQSSNSITFGLWRVILDLSTGPSVSRPSFVQHFLNTPRSRLGRDAT